jgi:hypothetical protein
MHHPRPDLAKQLADELLGLTAFSDAPNGLFLAAPRRTGKTEFLKLDLKPELEHRGQLVLYVDLWENKNLSPMDLIAKQLSDAVKASLGMVAKAAKSAGLDSITIPGSGIKIDLSKIGKTDGMTLHQVLQLIREQSGKNIVLMIDEAQHALTTAEGEATMSALKSARDQMRGIDGSGLLLVMSGSHRDKLLRLVSNAAAPFWGSQVRTLPSLDKSFVNAIANEVRRARPELLSLSEENLQEAFRHFGERPQFFMQGIAQALPHASDVASFDQLILQNAQGQRQRDREEYAHIYLQLNPLEQAVLWRLLVQQQEFRPYDAASLAFYAAQTSKKTSAASAQKALEGLRDPVAPLPPIIWKSLRGEYSLYDQGMQDWYVYLCNANQWPPRT